MGGVEWCGGGRVEGKDSGVALLKGLEYVNIM